MPFVLLHLILFVCMLLGACSSGNEPEDPGQNPTPVVSSLQPSSLLKGGPAFTLVVKGERFVDGATVRWNGADRPTTRTSAAEVRAQIPAGDLTAAGRIAVTVVNPSPGGGASSARYVEISEVPVASVTVSPNPATVAAGATVTLMATARDANGKVIEGRPVTWQSAAEQVATVSAEGIVTGVAPGGTTITAQVEGQIAGAALTVTAAAIAPSITGFSPAIAVAGDPAMELTVQGTGFGAGTTAHWNGEARTTRVVSERELRVELGAADLAQAGSAQVVLRAPGGESSPVSFPISAGAVRVEVRGNADLWSGDQVTFRAIVWDAAQRELPGRTVQWSSGNGPAARVDGAGVVTADGTGEAIITARVGTASGTARVQVLPRPLHDLIFSSTRGGRPMLLVQRPGTDPEPRALMADGRYAVHPAVSPDGQWIAFTSLSEGNNSDIYVVRRDGTGLRRLTTHPAADEQPAWSPDGSRIAFRSERTGAGDIYVMSADGGAQTQVTGREPRFGDFSGFHPTWTPDGSRLVYAEGEANTSPFRSVLMTVRPDGGDLRVFVQRSGYSDESPRFSPDGRYLTVTRRRVGSSTSEVAWLWADGTEVISTEYPGAGREASWSPDGAWLALVDADGDVVLTRPGESLRRKVTNGLGGGNGPVWAK